MFLETVLLFVFFIKRFEIARASILAKQSFITSSFL